MQHADDTRRRFTHVGLSPLGLDPIVAHGLAILYDITRNLAQHRMLLHAGAADTETNLSRNQGEYDKRSLRGTPILY
jgi:hypothetical protein